MLVALLALAACCLPTVVVAQDTPKTGRAASSLFRPAPRELMREMSTDRPDQTESPYTVDAGHVQVEVDFVSAVFDRDRFDGGDVRVRDWGIAPLNVKLGLLNNVDVQFVLNTYASSRVEDRVSGMVDKASGFGDVSTRVKINLWGNDGGSTALAIMPFLKWPLSASGLRNGKTEGGVIIPLAVALPHGWGMGLMTECDLVRNAANDGYNAEFVNSVTFSHDIAGNLAGYVEFVGVTGRASGLQWQGQFDVGVTFAVNDRTQLDLGCNLGITKSAPGVNPFVGLSWRY